MGSANCPVGLVAHYYVKLETGRKSLVLLATLRSGSHRRSGLSCCTHRSVFCQFSHRRLGAFGGIQFSDHDVHDDWDVTADSRSATLQVPGFGLASLGLKRVPRGEMTYALPNASR